MTGTTTEGTPWVGMTRPTMEGTPWVGMTRTFGLSICLGVHNKQGLTGSTQEGIMVSSTTHTVEPTVLEPRFAYSHWSTIICTRVQMPHYLDISAYASPVVSVLNSWSISQLTF